MELKPIASNMTELKIGFISILFSYETPVALKNRGTYYKTNTKWSNTTTRHINKWLDGAPATPVEQQYFDDALQDDFKLLSTVFYEGKS
jgi:hypothetical protein